MTIPPRKRTPVCLSSDRNFDDLAPRFARNVYGGLKGELRLAVLRRDFLEFIPVALLPVSTIDKPLRVLDAGGGQGQFSLQLAACGHHLTLCDISNEMLNLARRQAVSSGVADVEFVHTSIQDVTRQINDGKREPFDLVLCHSVLEWVADQEGLVMALQSLLRADGHLSLTFYNRHGLVMKNLLRGRRPPILDDNFLPSAGSLTPTRPLNPQQVLDWMQQTGVWQILCHSGIRVFHDLLLTEEGRAMSAEDLLALELELSRQEPYRALGRYQHVLARRLCPLGQTG
ncbi:MAG: methyltransferase domain-containing protein [Gammaproteobacteria bacterium]|nr:methyltransferase domain-containing protein [Gammaproteobacteria bacterium]